MSKRNNTTNRKPHNELTGYVCERHNPLSGGHTIIFDCVLAHDQGGALVQDYKEEGGRYQVVCNTHGTNCHTTSMPKARKLMKDTTVFCMDCRAAAGEGPTDEGGTPHLGNGGISKKPTNGVDCPALHTYVADNKMNVVMQGRVKRIVHLCCTLRHTWEELNIEAFSLGNQLGLMDGWYPEVDGVPEALQSYNDSLKTLRKAMASLESMGGDLQTIQDAASRHEAAPEGYTFWNSWAQ